MDHPIDAIEREAGLRLFVVHARKLPERLACGARMLVYLASDDGIGVWRVACPATAARVQEAQARVLTDGVCPDARNMSRLTLYGVGIRACQEVLLHLLALLRESGCRPEMITASEEEVSFLVPDPWAQLLFDRLCEAFPLSAGTAG